MLKAGIKMGFLALLLILALLIWIITYPFRKYEEMKERHKNKRIEKEREKRQEEQKKYGINTDNNKYPVFCESTKDLEKDSFSKLGDYSSDAKRGRKEMRIFIEMKRKFKLSNIFHGGIKFYPEGKPKFKNISQVHSRVESDKEDFVYYPDISYIDESKNLAIDIEVDEPYTNKGGEKEPIHYVYRNKDVDAIKSTDDDRNNRFNDKGWHVVRFSEKQVENHPQKCCEYIERVINYIEVDSAAPLERGRRSSLPLDKRWTAKEAVELER